MCIGTYLNILYIHIYMYIYIHIFIHIYIYISISISILQHAPNLLLRERTFARDHLRKKQSSVST